jgi:hypothetical protein
MAWWVTYKMPKVAGTEEGVLGYFTSSIGAIEMCVTTNKGMEDRSPQAPSSF